MVGTVLCLNAAAKITHRAQAIGSLASQWHALLTCSSADTPQIRTTSSAGSLEVANMSSPLYLNYSESDLESMDFITTTTNMHPASYISSYHKRQALGMQIPFSCHHSTLVKDGLFQHLFMFKIHVSRVYFVLFVLFLPLG